MNVNKLFILLFAIFSISISNNTFAQKSRAELEREKKENIRKIEEANRILEETKKQKKASVGQLNAIAKKIQSSEKQLDIISEEISLLDREVGNIEINIVTLQFDLENLKKEYAAMVYAAAKANNSYDKITFIFASKTFNQLVMRLKYMNQYADARKKQAEHIRQVSSQLGQKKYDIIHKKQEKQGLKHVQEVENGNLYVLKDEKSKVVKELSQKEKEVQQDLEDKKRSVRKLDMLIADMVRKEIERSRKAANGGKETAGNKIVLTPEAAALSANFAENKSKLPWPVKHGFISHVFGVQPHATLKNVEVENLGIDIQTNRFEEVRAVFKGKVIAVASVPGMNQVVMIQHGEYFTVYAKLKSVKVTTGQKVNAKDLIGEVYTDQDELSELQFQIWKNSSKMDPQDWLYNR
jgi:septal ring factor EnvC (AmiA/AmiB activator)